MATLKDTILAQFEPDVATGFIEFGKSLSRIKADVLIFMARKSMCLYEALLSLGIPPAEQCVVSDRILDMRLDPLKGKRIALIDDTLIVGTTLAKAKRQIESECGSHVSVHTFCIDTDWWCQDLITPDHVTITLNDCRVMTFCTAAVRALALIPRPYLVDFPIMRPLRVRVSELSFMLSSIEWVSYRLSTELQKRNNVEVFTFFPTEEVVSEWANGLGNEIFSCLDVIKVRGFARCRENTHWMRSVPIVTLKPLSEAGVSSLFEAIFDRMLPAGNRSLDLLRAAAVTPAAKQRLSQYCLSATLGSRFVKSICSSTGRRIEPAYDSREADWHYGPWLHDELEIIGRRAFPALWDSPSIRETNGPTVIAPVRLPPGMGDPVLEPRQASLFESADVPNGRLSASTVNLVSDFTEIFLRLYKEREIPARQEASRLGLRVLDATVGEAPNRDRLDVGIPWSLLLDYFAARYGVDQTPDNKNLFSLVLDICVDLGITVPITCTRDGVVFRAYRHGEDVRFSDGELALAHDAVSGFLKSSGRDSVPHLQLEKLLVVLIRVGTAKRFLEPLYGTSGVDGTVKIGFYLKGAVPILGRGPRDRADRNIWLSKYLVQRKVLKLNSAHQYTLDQRPEGNYFVSDAPDEAYEVGRILAARGRNGSFRGGE